MRTTKSLKQVHSTQQRGVLMEPRGAALTAASATPPPGMGVAGARARRVVDLKTPTRDGAKYDAGDVPVQWLAWLQHRRAAAPTLEELRASVERVATIQARAANVALRHDHERATLQAEHARLHAAAVAATAPAALPTGPGDGPDVPLPTTEPEGRGATFRPGQWTPGRVGSRGSGSAPS